jgi:hypothetical protein
LSAWFPAEPPIPKGFEHWKKCLAFVGQLISKVLGAVRRGHPRDDPALEQAREPVAEQVGRDALGGGGQIFKARATADQIPDDEESPAVSENVQTT